MNVVRLEEELCEYEVAEEGRQEAVLTEEGLKERLFEEIGGDSVRYALENGLELVQVEALAEGEDAVELVERETRILERQFVVLQNVAQERETRRSQETRREEVAWKMWVRGELLVGARGTETDPVVPVVGVRLGVVAEVSVCRLVEDVESTLSVVAVENEECGGFQVLK